MNRSLIFSVFAGAALAAAAVGGVRVLAGPLDPPGAPASTMPTLSELGTTLEGIEQSLAAPDPWAVPSERDMARATSVLLFVDGIEGSVDTSGVEGTSPCGGSRTGWFLRAMPPAACPRASASTSRWSSRSRWTSPPRCCIRRS